MKISRVESGKAAMSPETAPSEKILPKDRPKIHDLAERSAKADLTPLERGILVAQEALKNVPDIRQELVDDLAARIEAGEHEVRGEEIADMMLRRRAADRIR
jgi:anti-sigma28 factor (negative regulator of flagellin synthesis)